MKIAVLGVTGTAGPGSRSGCAGGAEIVEGSRATSVDLVSGAGLAAALSDVDAVVDASNPVLADVTPWGEAPDRGNAQRRRGVRRKAGAAARVPVRSRDREPAFDEFEHYLAKRAQERTVGGSGLDSTVVKTSRWYEFATNPPP